MNALGLSICFLFAAIDCSQYVVPFSDVKLRAGKDVVTTAGAGELLHVEKKEGEWLWVNHQGKRGWVELRQVARIDEYVPYMKVEARRNPKDLKTLAALARALRHQAMCTDDEGDKQRLEDESIEYYRRVIGLTPSGESLDRAHLLTELADAQSLRGNKSGLASAIEEMERELEILDRRLPSLNPERSGEIRTLLAENRSAWKGLKEIFISTADRIAEEQGSEAPAAPQAH